MSNINHRFNHSIKNFLDSIKLLDLTTQSTRTQLVTGLEAIITTEIEAHNQHHEAIELDLEFDKTTNLTVEEICSCQETDYRIAFSRAMLNYLEKINIENRNV